MGQKDLWQSDYFDNNVRFADAYNGIFFDGKYLAILPLENQSYVDYRMVLRIMQEELKPFVNNYKLNFYDYHTESDFSKFKTENRLLFEVLSHSGDRETIKKIFQQDADNYSLDREAAAALLGIVGMKMDLDKLKEEKDGKVEYKMCKAFEEITKEARDEGYKSGMDMGMETIMYANVTALMETMNLTLEQALNALKIDKKYREKFYS